MSFKLGHAKLQPSNAKVALSNFVAMTTGVSQGKMQLAAFDGPFPTPL